MAGPLWPASSARPCAWRVPVAGPPARRKYVVHDVGRPAAPACIPWESRHRRRVWLSLLRRSGFTELLKRRAPEPFPWSHRVLLRFACGALVPASARCLFLSLHPPLWTLGGGRAPAPPSKEREKNKNTLAQVAPYDLVHVKDVYHGRPPRLGSRGVPQKNAPRLHAHICICVLHALAELTDRQARLFLVLPA